MEIRLNKYISDSGYCSRREADKFIEHRSVKINGKVAEMGTKVQPGDVVTVNGERIDHSGVEIVYIALNKPVGIVSTTDPKERNNIVDFVNFPTRIFNIGRLDKMSEGLILLTNDGNIVNKILRAANNHDKEYEVMVDREITPEFLKRMAGGVPILGTVTKKCQIKQEGARSFRIILTQGLNRQIRRMCEFLGYNVVKLKRVRIMNISLGKLPKGHWRMLTDKEINTLSKSIESSDGSEKASQGAGAKKISSPQKKRTDIKSKTAPQSNKRVERGGNSSKPSRGHSSNSRNRKSTRSR